jgi:hypothetical protein
MGWPTATGLHPDVTAQEAKLVALAAAEKSNTLNVPKNMLFAGRQYVVRANVVVNWNGILQGSFRKIRAVRVEYNTISSVVYEGNGGEATEYAAPLANGADSVPVPGVFDSTQLQPHLMRTEILPRRKVTHVWYCRDMAADRNSCQLKGMSSPVAAAAPTTDKLDSFWPSPSPGDEDNLPDGTPLTIPPHSNAR